MKIFPVRESCKLLGQNVNNWYTLNFFTVRKGRTQVSLCLMVP